MLCVVAVVKALIHEPVCLVAVLCIILDLLESLRANEQRLKYNYRLAEKKLYNMWLIVAFAALYRGRRLYNLNTNC